MRKIPVYALKPGMLTGRNIYSPHGNLLLKADSRITESQIKKIDKLGIPAIYIDDSIYSAEEIEDVISETTRVKAIQEVKKYFSDTRKENKTCSVDINGLSQVADKIIEELFSSKSLMITLSDIRCIDQYTFGHSVNVCVLSVITGIALNFDRKKIDHLAIGALLHDIGKTMVPMEILNKPGALTAGEFEEIKKHSRFGYEILRKTENVSKLSAMGAYQHHERYDGSGYPQGLKGREIHEFGAIIGMVDMFDAITADRVYRRGRPVYEAFELLSASGNYYFEHEIVKAFLRHVAAYPTGTFVMLSDNSIGVVVNTPPGFSLYPDVRLLLDPLGNPVLTTEIIPLHQRRNIVVSRVLKDEEEIQALVYDKLAAVNNLVV
jgi:HD-GYP domain-containing protein (c-di-GMP phosphodiesterase class II)